MAEQGTFRLLIAGIASSPQTFLDRLIQGLADAGVEVTVGCPKRPHRRGVKWLPMPSWEGAVSLRLLRLASISARALVHAPGNVRRFARHIRRSKGSLAYPREWNDLLPFAGRCWDVIHFPWNENAIAHLPVFELGCPVVVSCRGREINVVPYNPKRSDIHAGLRLTFQRAAAIHCVSDAIAQEAMRYDLVPEKVWVIRPAIDPNSFSPTAKRGPENGILRIMTTGSLIWRKGYEYALQVVRLLCNAGVPVHFDIIGDGPERGRVLYTVQDMRLEEVVHLHGHCSPDEVPPLLQQADVFVLSSLSEGISDAVLEAMACGLPIVTTDCGGMREVVTDGVEGFVVPVRAPEAMAKAVMQLAENATLRRQMGEAGRARVLREFSLDQQVEQWMQLYRAVMAKKFDTIRAPYAQ